MGPLDCIRGRHALDGFGVHVDEDVFGDRFRRQPARRAGIAVEAAGQSGCAGVKLRQQVALWRNGRGRGMKVVEL